MLPAAGGKGQAVAYLAERMNLPANAVITAGDTGNDLDMMRPELRAIVVGNATAELRNIDSSNVYQAAAHHAAGIREGLVHDHWLERSGG